MGFEIEKKFLVGDFANSLKELKSDYGNFNFKSKAGFWFASNYTGSESMLQLPEPKFLKKEVALIKDFGEFEIPVQDFQYLRLRIINKDKFIITFKLKSLVNKIEQNTEYEYEVKKDIFIRVMNFLIEGGYIFYYNIKDTYEFKAGELKIELSNFNDLQDSYIEIEVVGDNENILVQKLEKNLKLFEKYSLKEEPRSYAELSFQENKNQLKNMKLNQYSRDAIKELNKKLNYEK